MNADRDQLTNVATKLDPADIESLEQSLAELSVCSGSSCHNVGDPDSWYSRRKFLRKHHDLNGGLGKMSDGKSVFVV